MALNRNSLNGNSASKLFYYFRYYVVDYLPFKHTKKFFFFFLNNQTGICFIQVCLGVLDADHSHAQQNVGIKNMPN